MSMYLVQYNFSVESILLPDIFNIDYNVKMGASKLLAYCHTFFGNSYYFHLSFQTFKSYVNYFIIYYG
jgi:hypothetical protein